MVDSPDKYRQIIDAAERVFGEHGYALARMDTIAEQAGVAKGTVYLYFESKQDLFASVVEDRVNQFVDLIKNELGKAQNPTEVVRTLILTRIQFFQRHQGFMYAMWQSLSAGDAQWHMRLRACQERIQRVVRDAVAHVLNPKSACSAGTAADAVVGATNFVVVSRVMSGEEIDPEQLAEELTALLVPGITGERNW